MTDIVKRLREWANENWQAKVAKDVLEAADEIEREGGKMTKKPIGELAQARARIKELENALEFYASKHAWIYKIDKCTLEITVNDGKLVVPSYPFIKFPALEDYGQIARAALGREDKPKRIRK